MPPAEWSSVIIATGPLTSPALAEAILSLTGEKELAFFDAIAPIVYRESINMDVAWFQSRYDKVGPGGNGKDYINCPMDKAQYDAFIDALVSGDKTDFKEWEASTPYFDGCLPIEVMAERGRETLRHGPMKPVGLTNPNDPLVKAHAIVQLRQDNALGTLFNMVGFQTKLKYGDQARVLRMIPGLENAEFARLGGLHRNTYLNSPKLLDPRLASEGDAAPALRRTNHRMRGLCGECRHRSDDRTHGGGGTAWAAGGTAPRDNGLGRPHQPHYRRPPRDDRRRTALVPAHERQFWSFPAARRRAEIRGRQAFAGAGQNTRQEERPDRPRPRGSGAMAQLRANTRRGRMIACA